MPISYINIKNPLSKKEYLARLMLAILFFVIVIRLIAISSFSSEYGLLAESLVFTLLIYFCRRLRYLYLLLIPLIIINAFQVIHVYSTGVYTLPLTLMNLNATTSIGGGEIIKYVSIFLIYSLSYIVDYLIINALMRDKYKRDLLCVISIVGFVFLEVSFCNMPIASFFDAIKQCYNMRTFKPTDRYLNEFERSHIVKSSYNFNIPSSKPNVIVIFIEGMSYRVISERLTPNLFKLNQESISFYNYFNHTAATFRGIRGQLISGYQFLGGYYQEGSGLKGIGQTENDVVIKRWKRRGENLISIFNNLQYTTTFLTPHSRSDQLGVMLLATGFDNVFGYEDYDKDINKDLSDKQQFEFIFKTAQSLEKKGKFFLASYTVGTHHGLDSPDLKFGDGENEYLNKFHNLDYWIGDFLSKFNNSSLFDNTILVVTADHATFPTSLYQKTFKEDIKYFIDKIPFMIYYKGVNPLYYDAMNRNSLDFSPTILDVCNFEDFKNHFLGTSLFVKDFSPYSQFSTIGEGVFSTRNGSAVLLDKNEIEDDILIGIEKFYSFSG